MLNTRKNTHRRNKTRRCKRRAGSPSYLKYTFNRWDKKYEAGINMDLSTRKLMKAQKTFANDIVRTLGLKTNNDTYNHFIKSLSTLTDEDDIEFYMDLLNRIQLGDIPFFYVNSQIKHSRCKYKDVCTRTNPLHKVQAHYLDWTLPLLEQLQELG